MNSEDVAILAERMLWTAFLISLPLLLSALVVGVLISIVQTVTGVQEMTLTFVPKIITIIIVLLIFLPWMTSLIVAFTENIFLIFSGQ